MSTAGFAVLAEDDSDAAVLMHLMRRHFNDDSLPIKTKGYDGAGGLLTKGARDIRAWLARGISRFVICHDADNNPVERIRERVLRDVVVSSGHAGPCCIAIPVQEIESWLIADEQAIRRIIPSFTLKPQPNPESIDSPKEWLVRQSRTQGGRPLYSPTTFNAGVAKHVRLDVAARKCPSFARFLGCLDECV